MPGRGFHPQQPAPLRRRGLHKLRRPKARSAAAQALFARLGEKEDLQDLVKQSSQVLIRDSGWLHGLQGGTEEDKAVGCQDFASGAWDAEVLCCSGCEGEGSLQDVPGILSEAEKEERDLTFSEHRPYLEGGSRPSSEAASTGAKVEPGADLLMDRLTGTGRRRRPFLLQQSRKYIVEAE
eukprot:585997-Hanusia_phi.AAC.1